MLEIAGDLVDAKRWLTSGATRSNGNPLLANCEITLSLLSCAFSEMPQHRLAE